MYMIAHSTISRGYDHSGDKKKDLVLVGAVDIEANILKMRRNAKLARN